MAFIEYLKINGELLPFPDSYEVSLSSVESDSSGETEAGTKQHDVVRQGVVDIDPAQITSGTLESLNDRMISDSSSAAKYQDAMNYLKGHILFYESYIPLTEAELNGSSDSHSYYARRIDPEEGFDREYTVTDEMVGQPQQVIVYWIWPNTFAQMEYDNGNLRQYRTKIVPQMRRQFFRQNVQNERSYPDGYQASFVQNDEKRVPQGHFLRAQQMWC